MDYETKWAIIYFLLAVGSALFLKAFLSEGDRVGKFSKGGALALSLVILGGAVYLSM